jgi:hypothetical protein
MPEVTPAHVQATQQALDMLADSDPRLRLPETAVATWAATLAVVPPEAIIRAAERMVASTDTVTLGRMVEYAQACARDLAGTRAGLPAGDCPKCDGDRWVLVRTGAIPCDVCNPLLNARWVGGELKLRRAGGRNNERDREVNEAGLAQVRAVLEQAARRA